MAAGHDARTGGEDDLPPAFVTAVEAMRNAAMRAEVDLEEMPAPRRIASYAFALTGDVTVSRGGEEEDLATGRIVLLHEPDGNEAWDGTFRCVAYVRAEVEDEVAGDDGLLGEVGWSWLTEALDNHGAGYRAAAGTVTCVTTQSFGQMHGEEHSTQVEIRASWTPADDGFAAHTRAWGDLMCMAGGLAPVPEGVAVIPSRRRARS